MAGEQVSILAPDEVICDCSRGKEVGNKVGRERQKDRQESHRRADGEEIPREDTARLTAPAPRRATDKLPVSGMPRVTPARASRIASGNGAR